MRQPEPPHSTGQGGGGSGEAPADATPLDEGARFRPSFAPVYLTLVLMGGALGALYIRFRAGPDLDPIGLAVAGGAVLIAAIRLTSQLIRRYEVYVLPEGIRGANTWGLTELLPWDSIRSVSRFNLVLLRFLIVRGGPRQSRLWILRTVTDPKGFEDRVLQHAGRANPLTSALL